MMSAAFQRSSLRTNQMCLFALCIAITWLPTIRSFTISSLVSYKVMLQPPDIKGTFQTTTYNGISRVRCAAIAALNPNSTFCSTNSMECIAVNTSFPPGYDNSNGVPFHHCFTNKKPLFDMEAALQDCRNNGNCCPSPFRNITDLGCVYTPVFWWFPLLPYAQARKMCQSFWPSGDLFIKPTNWTALEIYFKSRFQYNVWVGATRVGTSSDFEWIDGTPVAQEDYGRELVYQRPYIPMYDSSPQPDGRNKQVFAKDIEKPDCLLVLTSAEVNKLADDSCYLWTAYICLIT